MPRKTPDEKSPESAAVRGDGAGLDLRWWIDARRSVGTIIAGNFRIVEPLRLDGGWRRMMFAAVDVPEGRAVTIVFPDLGAGAEPEIRDLAERAMEVGRRAGGERTVRPLGLACDARYGVGVVFELFEGERLIDRMQRIRPMPLAEAHPLFDGLLETLDELHRAGVVHGSLRPRDVFLERRSDSSTHVRIELLPVDKLPARMDLSKALVEDGPPSRGVFAFMPPEQIGRRSERVNEHADVYAAAAMSYLALSGGVLPHPARNMLILLEQKCTVDPRPLSEALGGPVDPRLERFLARALARRREDRFPSAAEARAAWREIAAPPTGAG